VKAGAARFVGSSGGNAGMAMAVAARALARPLTIFIPRSTLPFMVEKLEAEGATVVVAGENWNEANGAAVAAAEAADTFLVHPFNQPDTWDGHASLVEELRHQLAGPPSALLTCVGGGGLALGLLLGLDTAGWAAVPLIAMETEGANCLLAARKAGHNVTLPAITSVATSLGALSVCPALLERCLASPARVISRQVTDSQAKAACVRFAADHRILVEPACGAALSAVYSGQLDGLALGPGPLVVVVCGGNIVTSDLIVQWEKELEM